MVVTGVDSVDNWLLAADRRDLPVGYQVGNAPWGCELHGEDFPRINAALPRTEGVMHSVGASSPQSLHGVIHRCGEWSPRIAPLPVDM